MLRGMSDFEQVWVLDKIVKIVAVHEVRFTDDILVYFTIEVPSNGIIFILATEKNQFPFLLCRKSRQRGR